MRSLNTHKKNFKWTKEERAEKALSLAPCEKGACARLPMWEFPKYSLTGNSPFSDAF